MADWNLAAYDKAGGKFSHCGIFAGYKSGITMYFTIFANYQWRVGWSHDKWTLAVDQKVPVTLFVDGNGPHQVVAYALSKTYVSADLPANAQIFDLMRKGYRMTAHAQGNEFNFKLDGTYAALTELLACVDRFMKPAPPPTPPLVGTLTAPKAAPKSDAVSAEDRLEATKVVANILAQGEMTGFKILSAKEIEETKSDYFKKSDVVWRADGVIGTLRIVPKELGNAPEIVAAVLGDDAKGCKGQFASGSSKDDKGTSVVRMFTGCKDTDGSFETHYTVVPLANGSYYLFATIAKSTPDKSVNEAAKADTVLRQAVFEVLKK